MSPNRWKMQKSAQITIQFHRLLIKFLIIINDILLSSPSNNDHNDDDDDDDETKENDNDNETANANKRKKRKYMIGYYITNHKE